MRLDACSSDDSSSYALQKQVHKPLDFCYYIKCFNDVIIKSKPVLYLAKTKDEDLSKIFIDYLETNIKQIYYEYKFQKPMKVTHDDR